MPSVISEVDCEQVSKVTKKYWDEHVKAAEFRAIFAGKEIGHRIADYVDEKTTDLLDSHFDTRTERGRLGRARARSMGDVWLRSLDMYNPVNVKAGEAGKNGQPNLVSLNKLLLAVVQEQIDSYYLLIVKMRLISKSASENVPESELVPDKITPNVYFVDMLDYLDYVTFDAGPGQAMLKEAPFYADVDAGVRPPAPSLQGKVARLVELLEDGHERLLRNRARRLGLMKAAARTYMAKKTHTIDQRGLNLG